MAPQVTFEIPSPSGGETQRCTVSARAGQTLLEVAIAHDIPIQHACGGFCACTTCHVHVKGSAAGLGPMQEEEEDRIGSVDRYTPESRLACQTPVTGDVTVTIQNVDG